MTEQEQLVREKLRAGRASRRGFTLIELLCVIAIIGVIMSMSIMSISGMSGRRLASNAYELADVIRSARASAIAQNTYVAIGFYYDQSAQNLLVAPFISKSGQPSDYQLLSRCVVLKGVEIAQEAAAYLGLPNIDTEHNMDVSESTNHKLQEIIGGRQLDFENVIVINPHGELVNSSEPTRCLSIGLQPTQGAAKERVAAVQISGLSGNVSVFLQ